MKKTHHKLRITALAILAVCAYVFLVGYTFGKEIDDFFLGWNMGKTRAEIDNGVRKEEPLKEVYYLNLKPHAGYLSFPDSMTNLKDNRKVEYRSHYVKALTSFNKDSLKEVRGYEIARITFGVIVFILFLYIPVLFFKFIFSLMDEVVFQKRNIRTLRRLGVSLIALYVLYYAMDWCSLKINQALFSFEHYRISQNTDSDFIWVLLGIVVLLFAEILAKGSTLQEEQELTI